MKTTASLGLAAMACFAACSSPPPYVGQMIDVEAEPVGDYLVLDKELNDIVRFGPAACRRVAATNLLEVVVPIRNIDDEQIRIWAEVTFLNRHGQPIADDTSEAVRLIPTGATISHVMTSSSVDAQGFTLQLHWDK